MGEGRNQPEEQVGLDEEFIITSSPLTGEE
jgi:hypothetical protein